MKTIVIADDSRTIRTQLRRTLMDAGYNVVEATDGVEAVQKICAENPVLAIVDINMPELDGYGVCQTIRDIGRPWNETPVIFLTSMQSHALEVLGREMGAYLKKPVDPDTVLKAVREFALVSA